jgi:hypothetical protein
LERVVPVPLAVAQQPEEKTSDKKKPGLTVPIELRLALTLEECAALTGLKICALRAAIWSGDLAFVRSGERGQYVIRRESLQQFLREQEQRRPR